MISFRTMNQTVDYFLENVKNRCTDTEFFTDPKKRISIFCGSLHLKLENDLLVGKTVIAHYAHKADILLVNSEAYQTMPIVRYLVKKSDIEVILSEHCYSLAETILHYARKAVASRIAYDKTEDKDDMVNLFNSKFIATYLIAKSKTLLLTLDSVNDSQRTRMSRHILYYQFRECVNFTHVSGVKCKIPCLYSRDSIKKVHTIIKMNNRRWYEELKDWQRSTDVSDFMHTSLVSLSGEIIDVDYLRHTIRESIYTKETEWHNIQTTRGSSASFEKSRALYAEIRLFREYQKMPYTGNEVAYRGPTYNIKLYKSHVSIGCSGKISFKEIDRIVKEVGLEREN
jgi:hypothetical protein